MNEPLSSSLAPVSWVAKRDGRLVPFEADKICRALFAAGEAIGRPDAFTARELTDVILHFLATEANSGTPTTQQIAELIVKVLRELGQAALARTFAEGKKPQPTPSSSPPEAGAPSTGWMDQLEQWVDSAASPVPLVWRAGAACLRDFSLQRVFSRDLAAAHAAGLITLTGLETPRELAACVLGPQAVGCGPWAVGERLVEAIEEARHAAGTFLALDSPEYGIAHCPQTPGEYAHDLLVGLRANGIPAVLNLNCATPPVWADELAEGPLFAEYRQSPTPKHLAELADTLLEELALRHRRQSSVRIDWHLGADDFTPEGTHRLTRVVRWVAEGAPVAFVFDRPRQPVALAEGMDRKNTALLLTVGLHLPRLAELLPAPADPELFLQKLGSLVRLALSAAVQKREFLRRHCLDRPALTRGFLLERARLLIAPLGLEALVRKLFGEGLLGNGPGLEFARRTAQRLRALLSQDGPACQLAGCLDGPSDAVLGVSGAPAEAAGLTAWDSTGAPESQLRVAGQLHASGEAGSCAVLFPAEGVPGVEALAGWLRYAWGRTDVLRLRFVRCPALPTRRIVSWTAEPSSAAVSVGRVS